jgi:hypothetical protein
VLSRLYIGNASMRRYEIEKKNEKKTKNQFKNSETKRVLWTNMKSCPDLGHFGTGHLYEVVSFFLALI